YVEPNTVRSSTRVAPSPLLNQTLDPDARSRRAAATVARRGRHTTAMTSRSESGEERKQNAKLGTSSMYTAVVYAIATPSMPQGSPTKKEQAVTPPLKSP